MLLLVLYFFYFFLFLAQKDWTLRTHSCETKGTMYSSFEAEASPEWRLQQLGGIPTSRTSDDSVASDAVYTTHYVSVSQRRWAPLHSFPTCDALLSRILTIRPELCARGPARSQNPPAEGKGTGPAPALLGSASQTFALDERSAAVPGLRLLGWSRSICKGCDCLYFKTASAKRDGLNASGKVSGRTRRIICRTDSGTLASGVSRETGGRSMGTS